MMEKIITFTVEEIDVPVTSIAWDWLNFPNHKIRINFKGIK